MNTVYRLMREEDLPAVMHIVHQAQKFLCDMKVPQWNNGYPDEAVFRDDMAKQQAYVVEADGAVAGIFTACPDGESTYDVPVSGQWPHDTKYMTLHRTAVGSDFRGLGLGCFLLKAGEELARLARLPAVRLDTHELNVPMRGLVEKNGYRYCCVIRLKNGGLRAAYEKTL